MEKAAVLAGMLILNGKQTDYDGYRKYTWQKLSGIFSPSYNCVFDSETGWFARWGDSLDDDTEWCPFGNELVDIEISAGDCSSGAGNGASGFCRWCYKNNTAHNGHHMSLESFKMVLDHMPPTCFQVALGITDADKHPDLIEIMKYCRENDIVPNLTTAGYGLPQELLEEIASLAGAVAVSAYPHNTALAYETIRKFQNAGLEQVNMHLLYYADNMPFVYSVLHDIEMGYVQPQAVVLLGLKPKGRGSNLKPLPPDEFTKLMKYCLEHNIPVGMDSCSASKVLKAVDDLGIEGPQREHFHTVVEPCESGLFSIYVNVDGKVFPCSFTEGGKWGSKPQGINLLSVGDFVEDVWNHVAIEDWRDALLHNKRACPVYRID